MQSIYFLEITLGEPIISFDFQKDMIAFGTIGGTYGLYNLITNKAIYCH